MSKFFSLCLSLSLCLSCIPAQAEYVNIHVDTTETRHNSDAMSSSFGFKKSWILTRTEKLFMPTNQSEYTNTEQQAINEYLALSPTASASTREQKREAYEAAIEAHADYFKIPSATYTTSYASHEANSTTLTQNGYTSLLDYLLMDIQQFARIEFNISRMDFGLSKASDIRDRQLQLLRMQPAYLRHVLSSPIDTEAISFHQPPTMLYGAGSNRFAQLELAAPYAASGHPATHYMFEFYTTMLNPATMNINNSMIHMAARPEFDKYVKSTTKNISLRYQLDPNMSASEAQIYLPTLSSGTYFNNYQSRGIHHRLPLEIGCLSPIVPHDGFKLTKYFPDVKLIIGAEATNYYNTLNNPVATVLTTLNFHDSSDPTQTQWYTSQFLLGISDLTQPVDSRSRYDRWFEDGWRIFWRHIGSAAVNEMISVTNVSDISSSNSVPLVSAFTFHTQADPTLEDFDEYPMTGLHLKIRQDPSRAYHQVVDIHAQTQLHAYRLQDSLNATEYSLHPTVTPMPPLRTTQINYTHSINGLDVQEQELTEDLDIETVVSSLNSGSRQLSYSSSHEPYLADTLTTLQGILETDCSQLKSKQKQQLCRQLQNKLDTPVLDVDVLTNAKHDLKFSLIDIKYDLSQQVYYFVLSNYHLYYFKDTSTTLTEVMPYNFKESLTNYQVTQLLDDGLVELRIFKADDPYADTAYNRLSLRYLDLTNALYPLGRVVLDHITSVDSTAQQNAAFSGYMILQACIGNGTNSNDRWGLALLRKVPIPVYGENAAPTIGTDIEPQTKLFPFVFGTSKMPHFQMPISSGKVAPQPLNLTQMQKLIEDENVQDSVIEAYADTDTNEIISIACGRTFASVVAANLHTLKQQPTNAAFVRVWGKKNVVHEGATRSRYTSNSGNNADNTTEFSMVSNAATGISSWTFTGGNVNTSDHHALISGDSNFMYPPDCFDEQIQLADGSTIPEHNMLIPYRVFASSDSEQSFILFGSIQVK